jgi:hypothetical protein
MCWRAPCGRWSKEEARINPPASAPTLALEPEFRLLAACSWLAPSANFEAQAAEAAVCVRAGIRWDRFIHLARRHQVTPVIYKFLRRSGIDFFPEAVERELKARGSRASAQGLHTAAELVRLTRSFHFHEIDVIPLKGALLSLELFGDPALRHAGDVDLMVRPEDADRADGVLQSLGYRCAFPGQPGRNRGMRKLLRAHSHECPYWHDQRRVMVDLHWGHELWTPRANAELWDHTRTVDWMGLSIRQLDQNALLLYLCDHGAKHQWSRLKWLSDVQMALVQPRASPWSGLFKLAARLDLERSLAQAGVLLRWVYRVDLPPPLADLIREDPSSTVFAAEAWETLRTAPAGEQAVSTFREPARRRKRFAWSAHWKKLLFQVEDFKEFPALDGLAWLYYPLRPALWFRRRYFKGGSA